MLLRSKTPVVLAPYRAAQPRDPSVEGIMGQTTSLVSNILTRHDVLETLKPKPPQIELDSGVSLSARLFGSRALFACLIAAGIHHEAPNLALGLSIAGVVAAICTFCPGVTERIRRAYLKRKVHVLEQKIVADFHDLKGTILSEADEPKLRLLVVERFRGVFLSRSSDNTTYVRADSSVITPESAWDDAEMLVLKTRLGI